MRKFLFLKKDKSYLKLLHQEIIYLETHKRCTKIVTIKKAYFAFSSLYSIQKKLPDDLFCRIHQSYIISLEHLYKFDNTTAYISNLELPIGRGYRNTILNRIEILNCDSDNHNLKEPKIRSLWKAKAQ